MSKKAMEMKIVVLWIIVIITSIILLIILGVVGAKSKGIVDLIGGMF
jgi:hypothetical protein